MAAEGRVMFLPFIAGLQHPVAHDNRGLRSGELLAGRRSFVFAALKEQQEESPKLKDWVKPQVLIFLHMSSRLLLYQYNKGAFHSNNKSKTQRGRRSTQ